jgi:uncharacterized pyridoxal phosphate-containing UPF0001 family protein
VSIFQS